MRHFFAYGTLMCPDIMEDVAGCRLEAGPASATGFRCTRVRDEDYPALVPEDGARVGGVVYFDLPETAWERLDRFEGEMYVRQTIEAELDSDEVISVDAYVVRPEFLSRLDGEDWSFAQFLREGKARFQAAYKGYSALEA